MRCAVWIFITKLCRMDADGDLTGYGPAMLALSERQRLFVLALLLQSGPRNNAAAAREAGYSDHLEAAKVAGFHLVRNEKVVAALQEETRRRMDGSALVASNVLIAIMEDEDLPAKERRAAAVAMLDRTGFGASQNINVHKTVVDRTGTAMAARIEALALRLGLDPAALLGVNAAPAPVKLIDVTPAKD